MGKAQYLQPSISFNFESPPLSNHESIQVPEMDIESPPRKTHEKSGSGTSRDANVCLFTMLSERSELKNGVHPKPD